jgi:hypothetical protein
MHTRQKRIAILGNSHSIAVKLAFEANNQNLDDVICFDAFHDWNLEAPDGEHCGGISVHYLFDRGDALIKFDDFDLFFLCAGGWWAARNEHLANVEAHPLASIACQFWLDRGYPLPTGLALVSEAAFNEMVYFWVFQHSITNLLRTLCRFGKKVAWIPWPAPNRNLKNSDEWALNSWYGKNGAKAWHSFFKSQLNALQKFLPRWVIW